MYFPCPVWGHVSTSQVYLYSAFLLGSAVIVWMCLCSDSQSFNKVAERVLLRLQEKLKGVEEGTVLSVGGQVNLLIQQAMDPKNLSRLFPGWQAWVWYTCLTALWFIYQRKWHIKQALEEIAGTVEMSYDCILMRFVTWNVYQLWMSIFNTCCTISLYIIK